MKSIKLTNSKDILAFLNGELVIPFEYNSFITMSMINNWQHRNFHVYHFSDIIDGDKIVNWMICIASKQNLAVKKGIVEFVKLYKEKSVYRINVNEIESIDLEQI